GGNILAGEYDSHIYSIGAVITPLRRFSASATFSYQDTRTATANTGLIAPYKGDVYSVLANGTYILNEKTDVALNYVVSLADYAHDSRSTDSPPPLGVKYSQHALQATLSRRLTKNITTRLQYGYYYYAEPSAAGANDYRAHSIFAL